MFIKGNSDQHLLVLEKGQKVVESLTQYAKENNLKGGTILGIGAVQNIDIGYFDTVKKEYVKKFVEQDCELLQINGNISLKDGQTFVHVHATMSDHSFAAFGGHLFEAEVAVTVELFILPLGKMPERAFNSAIGLDLICKGEM